jgi:hypothetical protein
MGRTLWLLLMLLACNQRNPTPIAADDTPETTKVVDAMGDLARAVVLVQSQTATPGYDWRSTDFFVRDGAIGVSCYSFTRGRVLLP